MKICEQCTHRVPDHVTPETCYHCKTFIMCPGVCGKMRPAILSGNCRHCIRHQPSCIKCRLFTRNLNEEKLCHACASLANFHKFADLYGGIHSKHTVRMSCYWECFDIIPAETFDTNGRKITATTRRKIKSHYILPFLSDINVDDVSEFYEENYPKFPPFCLSSVDDMAPDNKSRWYFHATKFKLF